MKTTALARRTIPMIGTLRGRAYEVGEVVRNERVKDRWKRECETLDGSWEVVAVSGCHGVAMVTFLKAE